MRLARFAKVGGLIAFLIAQLVLVLPAQASLIPISIAGIPNADLRTYTNGTNYPIAPTTLTVGGVPFDLVPLDAVPSSLGIIQDNSGADVFVIPTSIFGATTIYTLMNSAFGIAGADIATVAFTGTGGASASFDLTEGFNIRDHFNGFFVNTVSDPTIVTANFPGDVRLDRQTFGLPSSFATQTLTQITFTGHSAFAGEGLAFLAAATASTTAAVPEPSAIALVGIALIAAFSLQRHRFTHGKP
jgi:hypothetical protein